jgi:transcriptional regulator GlxA family with amidase domain
MRAGQQAREPTLVGKAAPPGTMALEHLYRIGRKEEIPCPIAAPEGPIAPQGSLPAFVARVEEFCLDNLARPIGVEDMARVAQMSRYHFSRRFDKARGMTPGRYLTALRVERARTLLLSGELSVKEIAVLCGLGDANYLGKVFRKIFGISPGQLRSTSHLNSSHCR